MNKKIIISVLACDTPHYREMAVAARRTCFKDPPDNMSIYYVYNSRTWDTNVTSRVTDAMKNDKISSSLHIKADNQTFGDTAPYIPKQLCVEYLIDNEKLRHVVSEGETLKIVVPASKKFVITEANYGPPDYKDKIGIGDGQTKLIEDCFYYGGPEGIRNCLRKCVEFWGYCLENFEFDYIFRSNLGCWVSMDALNKLVNTLPTEGVYGGAFGTTKGRRRGIEFVSGSGFLLSRDLVELIWDYHKNDKDIGIEYNGNSLVDDVSIGAFLGAFQYHPQKGISIQRTRLPRIDLHENQIDSSKVDLNCHHYYFLHPKSPNCYYLMQDAIHKKQKNKPSMLAVLVNFGTEQIEYLKSVVTELKSFSKYDVTVVVQSNIPLDMVDGIDTVNIVQLDNSHLLPLTCRKVIKDNAKNYDYFIYSENDHLWKESHVDKMIEYEKILPEDRIPGLMQFELNEKGERFYPALHGPFGWQKGPVEEYGDLKFAHFTNVHQASFFLSRQQLLKITSKNDFEKFITNGYSLKCRVNTDIYEGCGMKKLICISEFEDSLIEHLPGVYCSGVKGRSFYRNSTASERSMQNQLYGLEFGGMGISRLMYDKILELIPNGSNILELGSGDVSTRLLSRHYNMFSIENNIDFIGKYQSKYIHTPLVSGWYDINAIKDKLPKHYELLLVDGPRGSKKTTVEDIQRSFNIDKCVIIVDDTNRSENKRLFTGLSNLFPHRQSEIISCHEKSFGIIYFQ